MKVVKSKDLTNGALSYSGHTYIEITSVKHSGSSPLHHLRDMNKVRSLPDFIDSFQDKVPKKR